MLQLLSHRLPRFAALANAYAFLDASLRRELKRLGRVPACSPGCHACCQQPVPVSHGEVMGIKTFLAAYGITPGGEATAAGMRLNRCPFLFEGRCVIYPVRPFACRRYLVFERPCATREEPLETRPGDVFRPSEVALLHVLNMTLPLYGLAGAPRGGCEGRDFFTRHTALIQQIQWQPERAAHDGAPPRAVSPERRRHSGLAQKE